MQTEDLKNSFSALADALRHIPGETATKAGLANPWFTPAFIRLAGENWAQALESGKLDTWFSDKTYTAQNKTCGIIMAGNIPLVGLHDLLCVLASGMQAAIKLSSADDILMQFAIDALCARTPGLRPFIRTDGNLKGIDFLIATGSNNSARYFDYYFRGIPSLIRKNRTSVAVLSGRESDAELALLADDIYTYFGLGCRNVSHLLLPEGMELRRLYEAYDKYMDHVNHHKYYNNYMYHKSIFLMNLDKHYDNGFMIFRENESPHASVATLNYHFYSETSEAVRYISEHSETWQCVVSDMPDIPGAIPFGSTQRPELWDYADNVNVFDFLKGKQA